MQLTGDTTDVCRSTTSNTKTEFMKYLPPADSEDEARITDVNEDGAKDVRWELSSHVQDYAPP
jgi:hypothetical protein